MAKRLGAHAARLLEARKLHAAKGRREQGRFLFEGPTLLAEAFESGTEIEGIFSTRAAYEATPLLADLEKNGVPVWEVDEKNAERLSDVTTPTGIVGVARRRFMGLSPLFARPGIVLALAGLNDPGNVGTLLRSAEAFGAAGVIFGRPSVDPYHPKVVRAAMGSLFRVPLALAEPGEVQAAAVSTGRTIVGLCDRGEPIRERGLPRLAVLVVGGERTGLGLWEPLCARLVAIPMRAPVESLNAGVAASIALFEAGGP
ncbi:MAG TPA: RNA methyltransferase [Candidatus Tyrphobacter sp.]